MGKKDLNKKNEKSQSKDKKGKKDDSKRKKSQDKKGKNTPKGKDSTPVVKVFDKKAIVDQYVPQRSSYHIYQDDNNVFNGKYFYCTLNKSDLNKNNNKYYIIQLLEHDTNKSLILFTRWGRVGFLRKFDVKQVNEITGPKLFMKKYNDKTINHNYKEIYIDYEAEVKKDEATEKDKKTSKKKKFKNMLSEDVMDLIRLIYNKQMINDNLHEIGYDSKKMPLGKLSPATLTNGLNVLKQIESELKKQNPKRENLMKFSSDFYTQIPHDFGFKKMSNFIIDSIEKVKEKIDMISSLSDMKITLKILENVDSENEEYENQEEKQINDYYKQLNCDIRSISKNEPIYSTLNKYLTAEYNKKDRDDLYYYRDNRLSLLKAYELNRHGEEKKFKDFGNKKLLWHGSRMTNFVGILSQGLRIAPPEAPSSGYLYGKGVYFADMSLKSSYYCYPVNNIALILLGEVSLGKEDKRTDTDYNLPSTLKKSSNSIHALSRLEPSGGETIDGDVFVPNGDVKISEENSNCSTHAEYIVYNVDQIRLRYLLKIKYN